MKKTLQSSTFGTLKLDDELFEPPIYFSEHEIPGHGIACVTLVAPVEGSADWVRRLSDAEETYQLITENEPSIRAQAASSILELHRTGFGNEWRDGAENLVSPMRLKQLTFFADGCFELWYDGGEAFHYQDVRLALDPQFRLKEVGLEG